MTVKEYLGQAYRLDQKINSDIAEAAQLRAIASSITIPALGDRVQSSQRGEASFVKQVEKLMALEESINQEIDRYVDLKKQLRVVISSVKDVNEQLVLRYRYELNYSWEQIAVKLNVASRTVRRWHADALKHVKLPNDPVKIL